MVYDVVVSEIECSGFRHKQGGIMRDSDNVVILLIEPPLVW